MGGLISRESYTGPWADAEAGVVFVDLPGIGDMNVVNAVRSEFGHMTAFLIGPMHRLLSRAPM